MKNSIIVSNENYQDYVDIELVDPSSKQSCNTKTQQEDIEDLTQTRMKTFTSRDLELIKEAVREILDLNITSIKELNIYLLQKRKKQKRQHSLSDLLHGYRLLCEKEPSLANINIKKLLKKKSSRTSSGVVVCAVVMSPYPNGQKFSCEFDCKYCPQEPGQPRSYLKQEPGVLRANRNKFDPKAQLWDRLNTYYDIGHPTDKLEIIVLGGTWSSYPKNYRMGFIRDIYYAATNFNKKLHQEELPKIDTLQNEKIKNQKCKSRIIGITIETRPDQINPDQLKEFRTMNVTRVQLGIQHTNERVLTRINRKCNNKHSIKAIKTLKDNCFKVDIHLMPDLPKPLKKHVNIHKKQITIDDIDDTVDMVVEDKIMFDTVINGEDWQADQWKIYPCEVTPFTALEDETKRGVHKPYGQQVNREFTELHYLLMDVKQYVPPWIRLNRVIRDIPSEYILGGNKDVSMRQTLQNEMKKKGLKCNCIRCREVKNAIIDPEDTDIFVEIYPASGGVEYFISIETKNKETLLGFLRLRLSHNAGKYEHSKSYNKIIFPELLNTALIRELHVYGQAVSVDDQSNKDYSQHRGYGKILLKKAFEIARNNNYTKVAVISGEGVKEYYKKFGFQDKHNFMILDFDNKHNKHNKNYINKFQ